MCEIVIFLCFLWFGHACWRKVNFTSKLQVTYPSTFAAQFGKKTWQTYMIAMDMMEVNTHPHKLSAFIALARL